MGGIFGAIGKVVGGVAKAALNLTPVGRVITTVAGAVAGGGRAPVPLPAQTLTLPGGVPRLLQGGGSNLPVVQGRQSPLGTVGVCGPGMRLKKDGGCTTRKRPHMNVMNVRAANRAVTRIKGARALLQRIERQMPKRAAPKGKGCGCKRR